MNILGVHNSWFQIYKNAATCLMDKNEGTFSMDKKEAKFSIEGSEIHRVGKKALNLLTLVVE